MGSGESRGEGAAHEWGSARVKAKLREGEMDRARGGEIRDVYSKVSNMMMRRRWAGAE